LLPLLIILIISGKIKVNWFIVIIGVYLLFFFLLNSYILEIVSLIKKKNYYLIYTSIEYLAFTSILYTYISNKKFRISIVILSILFISFLLLFYTIAHVKRVDSIPIGIESLLLFIYIFYYFYDSLKNFDPEHKLYEKPSFWFIAGIFVYLGITFFFNILGNYMENEQIDQYYHFSYFGDILKNILFSIALYVYSKYALKKLSKKQNEIPFLDTI